MAALTIHLPLRLSARASRATAVEPAAPLTRKEKPLTAVRTRDGSSVVATKLALYHQHPVGSGTWVRLGWEHVSRVDWHESHGLVLTGWTPEVSARTLVAVRRREPLLTLARERIAWTTLPAVLVPVGRRGHARITARRRPGTDHLLWMVSLGPGVADTAAVRAEVDTALTRLRADLGLGPRP